MMAGTRYIMSEELRYWLAWCTYQCHPFLQKEEIKNQLKLSIASTLAERNFKILELNIKPDHVFLDFLCGPNVQLSDFVKGLKGTSARSLLKEFPEIVNATGGKRRVWNPQYYVSSVGSPTRDEVQHYVDEQKRK